MSYSVNIYGGAVMLTLCTGEATIMVHFTPKEASGLASLITKSLAQEAEAEPRDLEQRVADILSGQERPYD